MRLGPILPLAALVGMVLAPPPAAAQTAPETVEALAPVATDDAALATALTRRLSRMEGLEDLTLSVDAGVVRLAGTAASAQVRREAETLVRRTEGVVEVENELDIAGGVTEQVGALGRTLREIRVFLPVMAFALVVFLLFVGLAWLAGRWSFPYRWLGLNPFLVELTRGAARGLVILVGLVVALQILDATAVVGAVLGTAGLVGLALGFAFRDVAENYVASVLLSLRQPFSPNDLVLIEGMEGKVVRLTSRATILLTLDGNHVRIPNARVFKGIVVNYTRNPKRRFDFLLSVNVDGDLVQAQQVGVEALRSMPGILATPEPWAHIEAVGESSVPLRFYGWIDQREVSWFKSKGEAIRLVKEAIEAAGLELPEPIYRVRLKDPSPPQHEGGRKTPSPAALTDPSDPIIDQIEQERRSGSERDLLDPKAPLE